MREGLLPGLSPRYFLAAKAVDVSPPALCSGLSQLASKGQERDIPFSTGELTISGQCGVYTPGYIVFMVGRSHSETVSRCGVTVPPCLTLLSRQA